MMRTTVVADSAGLSTQDWMLEQIIDDGPALIIADPPPETVPDETDAQEGSDAGAVHAEETTEDDLDPGFAQAHDLDDPDSDATPARPPDINAGAKRTLAWLGSGVALVGVVIVLAFLVLGGGPTPTPPPQHKAATTPAVVAVTTTPDFLCHHRIRQFLTTRRPKAARAVQPHHWR